MSELLISSFLVSDVSESFTSLTKNEWCEQNRLGLSPKMSDHEQFTQVPQRKWGIVSKSLRSLTKNEWMSELLIFLSKLLIRTFLGKKWVIHSEIWWANSQPW